MSIDPRTPSVFNDEWLASLSIEERNAELAQFAADFEAWAETHQDDPFVAEMVAQERASLAEVL